jgi:hypothetical protein
VAEGLPGMMKRAVDIDKFKGYQIKHSIQFKILTILIGEGSWANLWTIKSLLRGFEMVSGLKINFVKRKLFGLNVEARLLEASSSFLSCLSDVVPSKFLGIPIGVNPRRCATWKLVGNAMTKRLNSWSSRQLSYGDRITLINSVLANLPLYFFFFLRLLLALYKLLTNGIYAR